MARVGFNLVNDPVDAPKAPVRLWDCQTTWAHLEPAAGQWDWTRLDRLVSLARGPVLLVLGHPPEWAALGGPDGRQAAWLPPGSNRPPATGEHWDDYATAVATRYRGRIAAYQVWNEPGYPTFYTGSLDGLAQLTRRTQRLLREVDPAAVVVTAPCVHGPSTRRWLDAQRRAGWPGHVHAIHIYPPPGAGAVAWVRMLAEYRRELRRAGAPRRPVWVTETNFRSEHAGQGRAPSRLLLATVRRAPVARAYWYAWRYPQPFGIHFPR